MTIKKAKIQTIGKTHTDAPVLVLKHFVDGWTYEVQNLESGPLPLPWRAETRQAAEEQLKASYDDSVWEIQILEEG